MGSISPLARLGKSGISVLLAAHPNVAAAHPHLLLAG